MSTKEKYGFQIAPAAADSESVRYYIKDHLEYFGYPPDVVPTSVMWLGIVREEKVWGVFGIKPLGDKVVEIPDFYLHRSKWGILAGYAALEIIKELADQLQIEILTATPVWNKPQQRAQERIFGVDGPTHLMYRYRPWEHTAQASGSSVSAGSSSS